MQQQIHEYIIENKNEAYTICKVEEARLSGRGPVNLLFDKSLHKRFSIMNCKLRISQEHDGKPV